MRIQGVDVDEMQPDVYKRIWQEFIYFLFELKYGCPIDTSEHWHDHAERLKTKAERFLETFKLVAGASGFTPYMHAILAHVPEIAKVFGCLVKGCSHGAEALHQRIQNTTATSNRREDTLGSQVLKKELMSTMTYEKRQIKLRYKNETREHEHGGYMSKRERIEYEDMMKKACEACASRVYP